MKQRSVAVSFIVWLLSTACFADVFMATGFRIGEVDQTSAIVWTRVTRNATRNWHGHREPKKREPHTVKYLPSATDVDQRHGAVPGASGQVRVGYTRSGPGKAEFRYTPWVTVTSEDDYTHQFQITGLQAATTYAIQVQAREIGAADVSAAADGSFVTAAAADQWQNVRFGVTTGQSYWDLDHQDGYHIYPAMQQLNLQFLVPTGDTVYLDNEAPRVRTVELARFHWHRMYSLPRLVEFHRRVPGYWEADDHDIWCNDFWPAMSAKWMNPLTFNDGKRIYLEQVPMGKRTYRTIRWGEGLQIWMVEGRFYRSPNNMPDGPDKSIWGSEQLGWLKRTILESDADFRVLISPTPIVGPDRSKKSDNHANEAFGREGNHFRNWTLEQKLKNFYICCGDRHWQYMSIDPGTGLREFSCGPASDVHAGGSPRHDPHIQPFHRQQGGFLTVDVFQDDNNPAIAFRHRDIHGQVVNEFNTTAE